MTITNLTKELIDGGDFSWVERFKLSFRPNWYKIDSLYDFQFRFHDFYNAKENFTRSTGAFILLDRADIMLHPEDSRYDAVDERAIRIAEVDIFNSLGLRPGPRIIVRDRSGSTEEFHWPIRSYERLERRKKEYGFNSNDFVNVEAAIFEYSALEALEPVVLVDVLDNHTIRRFRIPTLDDKVKQEQPQPDESSQISL